MPLLVASYDCSLPTQLHSNLAIPEALQWIGQRRQRLDRRPTRWPRNSITRPLFLIRGRARVGPGLARLAANRSIPPRQPLLRKEDGSSLLPLFHRIGLTAVSPISQSQKSEHVSQRQGPNARALAALRSILDLEALQTATLVMRRPFLPRAAASGHHDLRQPAGCWLFAKQGFGVLDFPWICKTGTRNEGKPKATRICILDPIHSETV